MTTPDDLPPDATITRLLEEVRHGAPDAMERLLPLVYAELHYIAERHMVGERPDHTLCPRHS